MQAPQNWRMKLERYRLTGVENEDGQKSIVARPAPLYQPNNTKQESKVAANAA